VQGVNWEMTDKLNKWHGTFRDACGNDSNAGVNPWGPPGFPSWLVDVDRSEKALHEGMALFIGMAADMLSSNAQLQEDLRRGLLTVTLQCEATRCMSVLSVIGVALGYAGWLEMAASFVVLAIYLQGRPRERVTPAQLMAVITDAPEIPGPGATIAGQGGQAKAANGSSGQVSDTSHLNFGGKDVTAMKAAGAQGLPSLPLVGPACPQESNEGFFDVVVVQSKTE
jgi:hypothetical protein